MFVCWTCGAEYETPQELGDHITSDHDKNLDYLVCPKCDSIVSNLIIHYMSNHKGTPLPAGVQVKTINAPKAFRKVRQTALKRERRRQFKQGLFESAKNGKQLHYRSGWERDCYRLLEKAFSVKSYQVEPFPIPYMHQNKSHNYWPDILITFIDGTKALIEVKPLSQCPNKDGYKETPDQKKNDSKWQSANAYCQRRKMSFCVWTERAIQNFARHNPKSLTKAVFTNTKSDDDMVN